MADFSRGEGIRNATSTSSWPKGSSYGRKVRLLRILELSYNNVGCASDEVDKNFSVAFLELFHSAASE